MATNYLERVRELAHQIWEREGRPEGREVEHWLAAEREILGNDAASSESFSSEAAGRKATRAYDSHVKEFSKSGRVAAKVKEAAEALEGPERDSLKKAEAIGKRRGKNA